MSYREIALRRIMVLNPKGGCGKSTLATNLASFYALKGEPVALADLDPQQSALDWLAVRPKERPEIHGCAMEEEDCKVLLPHAHGALIFDAPAGLHGKLLKERLKLAQTVLIPILPSSMDIRAGARFVVELVKIGRVSKQKVKLAVVANRVRENTRGYAVLQQFLHKLDIPLITTLHDSQSYVHAAERGLSIFELAPSRVEKELRQWQPLLKWLGSKRSLPEHSGKKAQ